MKLRNLMAVVISSLLIGAASPAFADTASPSPSQSRADQIAAIQNQYNPLFDSEYARFMAIKAQMAKDDQAFRQYKAALADFLDVRRVINDNLASATSDLGATAAYADEETGEFASTLSLLEKQAAQIKTISCIKGKIIKKISGIGPKCPKGYKKK